MEIYATRRSPDAQKAEVDLQGTGDQLIRLYQALGNDRSELSWPGDGRPDPDDGVLLSGIEIERVDGQRLRVSVDWERRVLLIVGGDSEMQSFAANVLDLARETPIGSQHKFDYFDNHFYLDPESVSLTMRFV